MVGRAVLSAPRNECDGNLVMTIDARRGEDTAPYRSVGKAFLNHSKIWRWKFELHGIRSPRAASMSRYHSSRER